MFSFKAGPALLPVDGTEVVRVMEVNNNNIIMIIVIIIISNNINNIL